MQIWDIKLSENHFNIFEDKPICVLNKIKKESKTIIENQHIIFVANRASALTVTLLLSTWKFQGWPKLMSNFQIDE